jgi:cell division protein FtsN
MRHQRGGTFVGFIVGVMVGLGAALAVAIYVTKVPVPFTNKNQPRSAGQDAAEALKNKDWDPNTPLQGKTPVRPVAPSAGGAVGDMIPPPPPAAAPASPSPPVVAAPKSAASAAAARAAASNVKSEAKPAPSSDPLGDLAKAKSAGGTADPFTYFVQAGAFRTPEDAEAHRIKLSLMGMDAKVTEREQAGRTVYRVRLGPFDHKDAADRAKERLDSNGVDAALVRVQR